MWNLRSAKLLSSNRAWRAIALFGTVGVSEEPRSI
jgi:hypothetical protein